MDYTRYYNSTPVSDWTANGSKESGHDFIDQIDEHKGNIADQEARYQNEYGKVGDLQNEYDNAYKNQRAYGDIYRQAEIDKGVDDAKAQYQKSLASVNATQSAMNSLPSSINAGSNVVLNASQRNAALGNQMSKFQNTLDYQTRQNAGDLSQYQNALAAAQDLAKTTMGQEQTNVSQAMTRLQTQMDMANKLYDQIIQERQIMRTIYGQMYEDEYQHMQDAITVWAQKLQAETSRLADQNETARNNARIAAQNYATDVSKYLGSGYTWDGNGWNSPQNVDTSKVAFQDNLNKLYSQYKGEIDDLNNNSFWNYFNPFLGLTGDSASQKAVRAKEMQNKGFEDYLYNNAPWLQKDLREKYSDLLGYYGLQ